jgi:hypothetical protein
MAVWSTFKPREEVIMSASKDNDSKQQSRRRFLKTGFSGAASLAAIGVAATSASELSQDSSKEPESDQIKWVGAGYLMARPVNSNEVE